MEGKNAQAQWQWQTEGTSWKGVGIYHLTLTVTSRAPLLGKLVIPNNDPTQARVERTELGQALLDCQRSVMVFHPEIQVLQYCLMPDHLHSIWYVRRPMEQSIRYVAQGFWRAAKKAGRAHSYLSGHPDGLRLADGTSFARLTDGTKDEKENGAAIGAGGGATIEATGGAEIGAGGGAEIEATGAAAIGAGRPSLSSFAAAVSRENPLCELIGADAYYSLPPLFTEVPFIRPLSRRGQLQAMISYVQLNPQRLATKRLMPGFFRVQQGVTIAGRTYASVGNIGILQAAHFAAVHVHHEWVDAAAQGHPQALRNYMNGCVLAARKGTVMVSPFISPKEKDVLNVLLTEKHPMIVLADNGFRDYYKPSANLFDGVAAGRVLILSPWEYDATKRHISRADCMELNAMAEEIAAMT